MWGEKDRAQGAMFTLDELAETIAKRASASARRLVHQESPRKGSGALRAQVW